MLKLSELRTFQVLCENEWVDAHPAQIESGNIFRIFEPDGTPVVIDKKDILFATGRSKIDCESACLT